MGAGSRNAVRSLRLDTSWMVYSYVCSFLLQGGYFVLLARQLGAGQFGKFAAALAAVSIISPLATFGSGHLLLMSTSRDRRVFNQWLGTALSATLACGMVLIVVVLAVGPVLLRTWGSANTLLPLALSELFFARLTEVAAQCHQAHSRIRSSANALLSASVLRFVAVLILVGFGHRTAAGWAWLYFGASAAAGVATMTLVVLRYGIPQRPVYAGVVAKHGIYFSVGVAAKSGYSDIDKTMLADMASASATGIYTAAYRVLAIGMAPVTALLYASNARMFHHGEEGLRSAWRFGRRLAPLIGAYTVTAAALLALSAPLLPKILGPSYASTAAALRWLAPLTILQGAHFLMGDVLMGAGRQWIRSLAQLSAALVNVVANLMLIPSFSWRGASLASIVTEGLLAIILAIALWRLLAAEPQAGRSATFAVPQPQGTGRAQSSGRHRAPA